MTRDLDKIIAAMTLEEKASLCSGADFWTTKAVERLGILSWMMTDGPHGLRKMRGGGNDGGLLDSVPSTCFPSGATFASTWNRDLVRGLGKALGEEAKAEGVGVVLGPAVNIKRSPLCGRNFEYLSEDPYLAGEMAAAHIQGVQSRGVGTSLKHFAANNQERLRMSIDVIADERSLREIYLPAFETAVKTAQPWTVMCSYNKINGTYSAENSWLLTKVLKQEWGHTGIVVTDWGACNDRVAGLASGQELQMPGSDGVDDADIVAAVRKGALAENVLDASVKRMLEVTFRVLDNRDPAATYDADAHHRLCRRVAAEGMVLLKNDGGLLPIRDKRRVAFLGAFARHPRFQGGGSSHITPTRLDDAAAEAVKVAGPSCAIHYAAGYSLSTDESDAVLLAEARDVAGAAELAVVFIGLTDRIESEGYDRDDLAMPASHLRLLEEVLAVQKNVAVVLSNGAPIEMPWLDRVPAVLEGYLGGQAWGGAVADLLFGVESPSGKLAETFPLALEDTPCYLNFPGDAGTVEYREGLFVGYRYYDAAKRRPLFPFGHGLSYASFEYSALRADKETLRDTETLAVSLEVRNSGPVDGKEVVQLYVGDLESSVLRPVRELKGFEKITLKPGETKTVRFELGKRAFAFWSPAHADWITETGDFEIAVGSSSADLRSRAIVRLESTARDLRVWDLNSSLGEVAKHPRGAAFAARIRPGFMRMFGDLDPASPEARMAAAMAEEMPLRNLPRMARAVTKAELEALIDSLNAEG